MSQSACRKRKNNSQFSKFFFILAEHLRRLHTNGKIYIYNWPEHKEDDLHSTDDGEASEESHGATNETQLGLRLDLLVSLDVVKGSRDKVDIY